MFVANGEYYNNLWLIKMQRTRDHMVPSPRWYLPSGAQSQLKYLQWCPVPTDTSPVVPGPSWYIFSTILLLNLRGHCWGGCGRTVRARRTGNLLWGCVSWRDWTITFLAYVAISKYYSNLLHLSLVLYGLSSHLLASPKNVFQHFS